MNQARLETAFALTLQTLLSERNPQGYWLGELSTSALSTATAVSALALVKKHSQVQHHFDDLINNGLGWLAGNQNVDGGWGDTIRSVSNISTSMLCRAAFHLSGAVSRFADVLSRSNGYMQKFGQTPEEQAEAVRKRYGQDRTFAVPILTTCALAGLVDWREVPSLPFELACLPQSWFRFVNLPVVSYALPALIAIGQAVFHHRPPWNPVVWAIRALSRARSLRALEHIQPSNGGFLEAIPLTSFVTLSLASIGHADHEVARKGIEFLKKSVRPDGSWPIDTNLATWVTTLTVNALASANELHHLENQEHVRDWLLNQQFRQRHAYTGADPGAWSWTDLPGSVPDADDTPGALLALHHLPQAENSQTAALLGIRWLLDLQNRDGGWPTFCRGWRNLPFDRSGCDLTAHALRSFAAWKPIIAKNYKNENLHTSTLELLANIRRRLPRQLHLGLGYLAKTQRSDGSWLPLWFGNQFAPNDENPTYGTARVLASYRDLDMMYTESARRGWAYLMASQNADGGWGGALGVTSSLEETALAVEVLLDAGPAAQPVVNKGLNWLVEQIEIGALKKPTPIGFYFAKLWYFEKLYPVIFSVAALGRARRLLSRRRDPAPHFGLPT